MDEAWHGEIADRDPALYAIVDAAGLAHSKSMKSYLIMMAVRLLEMKRLLKSTGSIYLHCDPTASHYLKLLMDMVFGRMQFRNEVVWKRYGSHNDAKRFARVSDRILVYWITEQATWNPQYLPLEEDTVKRNYRYQDERGVFTTSPLQARTLSGGGYDYTWQGVHDIWKFPKDRLDELQANNCIYWPKRGKIPRRKIYLSDVKGRPLSDVITDIVGTFGKERVGYPTQKPLALLERIIKASSNEGDVILDPFCGCATTCIAAERLCRQWIGIDLSSKASELIQIRMQKEVALFFQGAVRTDIPQRTDQGPVVSYKTHKHTLFGKQEGVCNGCRHSFQYRNFTIDHKVPQAKGGTDHLDNLQLLCGACNSMKGAGTQEALIAKLKQEGIR